MQLAADVQDTEASRPTPPLTGGVGTIVHAVPFHASACGGVLPPTAMHAVTAVHDTPYMTPIFGVGTTVHAVPSHASASEAPRPCDPTAMHADGDAHDTADSCGLATFGVTCRTHFAPFHTLASVLMWAPSGSVQYCPTAVQAVASEHDTADS
jgi:hypothetical protein